MASIRHEALSGSIHIFILLSPPLIETMIHLHFPLNSPAVLFFLFAISHLRSAKTNPDKIVKAVKDILQHLVFFLSSVCGSKVKGCNLSNTNQI